MVSAAANADNKWHQDTVTGESKHGTSAEKSKGDRVVGGMKTGMVIEEKKGGLSLEERKDGLVEAAATCKADAEDACDALKGCKWCMSIDLEWCQATKGKCKE